MPLSNTRMKSVSLPKFNLNDALAPIDVRRILALLQLGLEPLENDETQATHRNFCDALTEIPP